jgi:hypothetical protein
MADYFVCLDTNVLVDLVQEIQAGKPPKWWDKLQKLIKDGKKAKLVVPEITILELKSTLRDLESELGAATTKAEADAKENRPLQSHLADSLKEWRNKTVEGWKAEAKKLETWLRAIPEQVIEYTESVGHRTKRRLIEGRLPRPQEKEKDGNSQQKKWLRDQDCAIVESLVVFFDDKFDDRILALGTKDKKDGGFGQIEDGKGSLNKEKKEGEKFEKGVGILDKTFAEGLPPAQLFDDMDKLVSFIENEGKVKSLSPEEQAVAQELKLKQEAVAGVLTPGSGGGTTIQIVVGDISSAHANPPSVTIRGQRVMPAMRLGGVYRGAYLVQEPEQGDQQFFDTFFDTSHVPQTTQFPVEGLQTFNASNLGDDEPEAKAQPKDDNPPKPEAEKQP